MNMHKRSYFFLLLLLWSGACHRVSASYNPMILNCGAGLPQDPAAYRMMKIVDLPVAPDDLKASLDGASLSISEKACVFIPQTSEGTLLVSSVKSPWGLKQDLGTWTGEAVRLRPLSENLRIHFDCEGDRRSREPRDLIIPFRVEDSTSSSSDTDWQLAGVDYRLVDAQGKEWLNSAALAPEPIGALRMMMERLPQQNFADGSYRAKVKVSNLRGISFEAESSCTRELDRTAPALDPMRSLPLVLAADQPIPIEPLREGTLLICFEKEETPLCQKPSDFQPATDFARSPGPGAWRVLRMSRDELGNLSLPDASKIFIDPSAPAIAISWSDAELVQKPSIVRDADREFALQVDFSDDGADFDPSIKERLQERAECRIDFRQADGSSRGGERALCTAGRCQGQNLADWQPCDASLRFVLPEALLYSGTQMRVSVRTRDDFGRSSSASTVSLLLSELLSGFSQDKSFPIVAPDSSKHTVFVRAGKDAVYAFVRYGDDQSYQLLYRASHDTRWYGPSPLQGGAGIVDSDASLLARYASLKAGAGEEALWLLARSEELQLGKIKNPFQRGTQPQEIQTLQPPPEFQKELGDDFAVYDMEFDSSSSLLLISARSGSSALLIGFDGQNWSLLYRSAPSSRLLMNWKFIPHQPRPRLLQNETLYELLPTNGAWSLRSIRDFTQGTLDQLSELGTGRWWYTTRRGLSGLSSLNPSDAPAPLDLGLSPDYPYVNQQLVDSYGDIWLSIRAGYRQGAQLRRIVPPGPGQAAALAIDENQKQGWGSSLELDSEGSYALSDNGHGRIMIHGPEGFKFYDRPCWLNIGAVIGFSQRESREAPREFVSLVAADPYRGFIWQLAVFPDGEKVLRRFDGDGWIASPLARGAGDLNFIELMASGSDALLLIDGKAQLYRLDFQSGQPLIPRRVTGIDEAVSLRFHDSASGLSWIEGKKNSFVMDTSGRLRALSRAAVLPRLKSSGALWGIDAAGDLVSIEASSGRVLARAKAPSAQEKIISIASGASQEITALTRFESQENGLTKQEGRLYTFRSGRWEVWDTAAQGLSVALPSWGQLHRDGRGHLWIETRSNLPMAARFDGKTWHEYSAANTTLRSLSHLTEDGGGRIWAMDRGRTLLYDQQCRI